VLAKQITLVMFGVSWDSRRGIRRKIPSALSLAPEEKQVIAAAIPCHWRVDGRNARGLDRRL
jgi:hypothetical protein